MGIAAGDQHVIGPVARHGFPQICVQLPVFAPNHPWKPRRQRRIHYHRANERLQIRFEFPGRSTFWSKADCDLASKRDQAGNKGNQIPVMVPRVELLVDQDSHGGYRKCCQTLRRNTIGAFGFCLTACAISFTPRAGRRRSAIAPSRNSLTAASSSTSRRWPGVR
jgi:hypothetical protein